MVLDNFNVRFLIGFQNCYLLKILDVAFVSKTTTTTTTTTTTIIIIITIIIITTT